MKNRITIKNNVKIINDDKLNYVIKKRKNNLDDIYKYLSSRSFNYFPKVLDSNNEFYVYEYVHDIKEPFEQKIMDMVSLLTLLHSKTTFYKEVDMDYYKKIYENMNNDIDMVFNYYEDVMNNIDSIIYMSPSNYMIARNMSTIYSMINYAKYNLDKWYSLVSNKKQVRVVNIHNNLKLEHYLKDYTKPYFISWDNSIIDTPVKDIVSLYQNNYMNFNFKELLDYYLSKYPLHEDEMILLFTVLSIPKKIEYNKIEYENVVNIRKYLDYIYKTSDLLREYSEEKQTEKG